LIAACKSKYKKNEKEDDTFSKLLSMFKSKIKDKTFVKNLSDLTDMYGNTLFHYLVIFGESQSVTILDIEENLVSKEKKVLCKDKFLIKDNRAVFGKPNKIGITPLEMAAYLGKPRMFKGLLVKTEQSVIHKKKEELRKLAKDGMEYHFDLGKSSKEMNIHLHFEKDIVDCIKIGTKEEFLEILKLLSKKMDKTEIRENN
jgi:ankyrin repeat protein